MDIQNIVKLLAIVGAAVGGVYARLFDFKKDGRVTRYGKLAIAGILVMTTLAIVINVGDIHNARTERLRLQAENNRQQRILDSTAKARFEIERMLVRLDTLKTAIDASSEQVWKRLDSSSARVARKLDSQLAQSRRMRQELTVAGQQAAASIASLQRALTDFDSAATWSLARLARPLDKISFSYAIVYDHADQRFPKYYERLLKMNRMFEINDHDVPSGRLELIGQNAYAYSNLDGEEAVRELDFERASIGFRRASGDQETPTQREYWVEGWTRGAERIQAKKIQSGELRALGHVGIDILADFAAHTIIKRVHFTAVKLIQNDGTLTSELDIVGPEARNLLVEVRRPIQSGFSPPRLSDFVIHFADTEDGSVSMPGFACVPSTVSLDAMTCRMDMASLSSPELCPAYMGEFNEMAFLYPDRCTTPEVATGAATRLKELSAHPPELIELESVDQLIPSNASDKQSRDEPRR